MTYYIGSEPSTSELLGGMPRYFYALRTTDDGIAYFCRVDNLTGTEQIVINNSGPSADNFNDFAYGVDYFDGKDAEHVKTHLNMQWDQYRWDNKSCFYYINDNGELVVRINEKYNYPNNP